MKKFLVLILVGVFLGGCIGKKEENAEATPVVEAVKPTETVVSRYKMEEVAKHDKKGDCWLLISGKVYNVSEFSAHPGGEAILQGCGKDATTLFETRPMGSKKPHSEKAREKMKEFMIGELEK